MTPRDLPPGGTVYRALRRLVTVWPDDARAGESTAPRAGVAVGPLQVTSLGKPAGQAPQPFALDAPIAASELLAPHVERGRSYFLAELAGLPAETTETLLTDVDSVRALGGRDLDRLHRDELLSAQQRDRLRLTLAVSRVVDDDPGMIRHVLRGDVREVRELAGWDAERWVQVVRDAEDGSPEGMSECEYAARLANRVDAAYPMDTLLERVRRPGGPLAAEHLDLLRRVHQRNADVELLALNYAPGSADLERVDFADDAERRAVLATVPALQRVRAIASNAEQTAALLRAGYTSAAAVVAAGPAAVRDRAGLGDKAARQVYRRANSRTLDTLASLGMAFDTISGRSGVVAVGARSIDISGYLSQLPAFADLFGSPTIRRCGEWESVLGPCAYFVDLMRFVERHVVDVAGRTPPYPPLPEHSPLHLRHRRPDLWALPMSRESAEVSAPVVATIARALENYVSNRMAELDPTVAPDPYRQLADATQPCSLHLPFLDPLRRLEAYLAKLGSTRLVVTHACTTDSAAVTAAGLGLSTSALPLVTGQCLDERILSATYGANVVAAARAGQPVPLTDFLHAAGLSLAELFALAQSTVVRAAAPHIRVTPCGGNGEHPDVGHQIEHLTVAGLDRIGRLVRLTRGLTPWTIREVDIVLESLGGRLDATTAYQMVRCKEIADRFGLGVEAACVLWGNLPRRAARSGARSLFDQLFNPPGAPPWDGDGPFPLAPADRVRLAAGLGLSEAQLDELTSALPAEGEQGRGLATSRTRVSMLLRHARLARLLGLTITELLALLRASVGRVATPEDLFAVLGLHDQWRSTRLPLPGAVWHAGQTEADWNAAAALADPWVTPAALRLGTEHPDILNAGSWADLVAYASLMHALTDTPTQATVEAVHDALVRLAQRRPGQGDEQPADERPADERPADEQPDATESVTRLTGITIETARCLLTNLPSDLPPVSALRWVVDAARLAGDLGLSGPVLFDVAAGIVVSNSGDEYRRLSDAADAVAAAALARHHDEPAWAAEVAAIETAMLARRRDALLDYLLHSSAFPEFHDVSQLHGHFLIDVETDPCVELPPLVTATNSVQRYVHRCIMGLEKSSDQTVTAALDPEVVPEWDWRAKYRSWQAARTVYLYPHRYLDPAIRASKSPLFAELESQLLQGPGTEDAIIDAFAHFVTGLDQLARLQVVACYRDATHDRWHFVATNPAGPDAFYYRRAEGLGDATGSGGIWLPWHKIEVPVTSTRPTLLVDRGRPHLLWVDVSTTRKHSAFKDGTSHFQWYVHQLQPKHAMLRQDGSWTPARDLTFTRWARDGIVDDLIAQGPTDAARYPRYDEGLTSAHSCLMDAKGAAVKDGECDPNDQYTLVNRGLREPMPFKDANGLHVYWGHRRWQDRDRYTYEARVQDADLAHAQLSDAEAVTWSLDPDILAPPPERLVVFAPRADTVTAFGSPAWDGTRPMWLPPPARRDWSLLGAAVHTVRDGGDDVLKPIVEIATGTGTASDVILGGADVPGYWPTILRAGPGQLLIYAARQPELVEWGVDPNTMRVHIRPLSSTVGDRLSTALFIDGIDGLMRLAGAVQDAETWCSPTPVGSALLPTLLADMSPIHGAIGPYLWELFLQAPFLLARHLTVQRRYDTAQRWYRYVFDPRRVDPSDPRKPDPWMFSPLRGISESLRDALTNPQALAAWRKDPFDPHAIAMVRPVAYQKAVALGYVENLVDWADELFTQYTPESLSQASLLYDTASHLLGERPAALGAYGEARPPRTYEEIRGMLVDDSPLLVEYQAAVETVHVGATLSSAPEPTDTADILPTPVFPPPAPSSGDVGDTAVGSGDWGLSRMSGRLMAQFGGTATGAVPTGRGARAAGAPVTPGIVDTLRRVGTDRYIAFGLDLWSHVAAGRAPCTDRQPVFLIPPDDESAALRDRLANRLENLRSGRDINGLRRVVAPYEPPVDPGLIIAGRAAGVSLTAATESAVGAEVPPYRFAHLIEKAEAAAAAAASLGSALQRALESHDGEQLAVLRLRHEENLSKLNAGIRDEEIAAARAARDAVVQERAATQRRRDHYQSLVDDRANPAEIAEIVAQGAGMLSELAVTALAIKGIAIAPMPQVGAPTALTMGGEQLDRSLREATTVWKTLARVSGLASAMSGTVARNQRREEDWRHEVGVADAHLAQLQSSIESANARLRAAERAAEVHALALKQSQEQLDFYGDKFAGVAMYDWLATRLSDLYQKTYENALSLARLAANAYRFERAADPPPFSDQPWSAPHAGLLAAETLRWDLATMRRRYLVSDLRPLEVEQHFSLAQIDPRALVALRATGSCSFTIPEVYFDVAYPGQYQRRITSVRVSVPCDADPNTNVNATLTLNESQVAITSDGHLQGGHLPVTASIATSSGQRDAGMFELSLRDDRYLPFEGAGAVDSKWTLQFPSAFRSFDYDAISDVLLHIRYTARYDAALRERKEGRTAATVDALRQWLSADGGHPLVKVFSIRHDFPEQRATLDVLRSGEPARVTFRLTPDRYPLLLRPLLAQLTVAGASIALLTGSAGAAPHVSVSTDDGEPVPPVPGGWEASASLGGLPAHPIPVTAATGDVSVTLTRPDGHGGVADSATTVEDILLVLPLRL